MLEKVITVPLKMTAQRQETLDTDTIVFSKDVNNVKLVIDVLDEQGDKINLDYNYQPSIAVRLPESGFKGIYDDLYIEDGKIVWWFDTSIITKYEMALINVYLKNNFRQYDLGEFIVMVDVSDIDTVTGEAKPFYIKKLDDWLTEFERIKHDNNFVTSLELRDSFDEYTKLLGYDLKNLIQIIDDKKANKNHQHLDLIERLAKLEAKQSQGVYIAWAKNVYVTSNSVGFSFKNDSYQFNERVFEDKSFFTDFLLKDKTYNVYDIKNFKGQLEIVFEPSKDYQNQLHDVFESGDIVIESNGMLMLPTKISFEKKFRLRYTAYITREDLFIPEGDIILYINNDSDKYKLERVSEERKEPNAIDFTRQKDKFDTNYRFIGFSDKDSDDYMDYNWFQGGANFS